MTKEEAAVAAQVREEHQKQQSLYGGIGAGLLAVGGVVFWCLNSADSVSRQKAAERRHRQQMSGSSPDLLE
jgi:hypothetical protein